MFEAWFKGLIYSKNKMTPETSQKEPSTPPRNYQNEPPYVQSTSEVSSLGKRECDLTRWANNAKVPLPLVEIVKFPAFKKHIETALGFKAKCNQKSTSEREEDPPIILLSTSARSITNPLQETFFMPSVLTDWILHNCMLDFGAAMNIMTLEVAQKMGLETRGPTGMCVLLFPNSFHQLV